MRKATPMKRLTSRTLLATALLGMAASGAALAQNTSGKLLATGGVSSIEGSGGGGLTTWALISGYGTDRQIGANAHLTGLHLRDFSFETLGVAVGIHDRVELSAAKQSFNTKNALVPINPALRRSIDSAACCIFLVSASNSSPAGVSTKRSGRRSNSRAPIDFSSALIRRAMVGWLT